MNREMEAYSNFIVYREIVSWGVFFGCEFEARSTDSLLQYRALFSSFIFTHKSHSFLKLGYLLHNLFRNESIALRYDYKTIERHSAED